MSDLMAIGLSGLRAYRAALGAVGENVANAETPGFARRSVRLAAGASAGGATDPFYKDQLQFNGVEVSALVRNWDVFAAAEARHASAAAGRSGVREQWLTGIETAFGDSASDVGARITSFFNAADTLAAAPEDMLNRSRMLLALEDVAGAFRNTAGRLERVSSGMTAAAQLDVDGLNQSLQALARINTSLLTAPAGGSSRAALEDESARLIDAIATQVDVVTTFAANGTVKLDLADAPGTTLIGVGVTASFGLTAAADGRLSFQLTTPSGTATINPATGKIAGYIQASGSVADRRSDLDHFAATFSNDINAWSGGGTDLSGAPGTTLLIAPSGAVSMKSLASDGTLIPAAAGGVANGNLLALAGVRASSGAEATWTGIVTANAQQLNAARAENAATRAWRDNSFAALDESTGVDLDREAADLLRYQQAYSASARVVQAGRDTIDAILKL